MFRDRLHPGRPELAITLRARGPFAALLACLLAVAMTFGGASAATRVESPSGSPAAHTHTTKTKAKAKKGAKGKKGKHHTACQPAKKSKSPKKTAGKGKKKGAKKTATHPACKKPKHKRSTHHKPTSKRKPTNQHKPPTKATHDPPASEQSVPPSTPSLPTGPSPAQFNREIYGYFSWLTPQAEAQRYSVMVLQGTDAAMVPILHAANPNLKIFVYVDILRAVVGGLQSCTMLSTDQAQHPDWLLTDSNGQVVDVKNVYHLDIGNPAYQQACASGAIAMAKQGGFDGVYFDGVDGSPAYGFGANPVPVMPKYTNNAVWQAAITSFLAMATPQIHAAGLPVIGNIGGEKPAMFEEWEGLMDGAEDESFTDDTGGPASWLYWWPYELADMTWSEQHNKLLLVHSHNHTEAGNTYGLATMMLAAGGHTSYSTANANYAGYEAWYPEYDTAEQLGAPLGTFTRNSDGTFERRFVHGIVLVNPSTSTISGIDLGGTYSGSGLTNVSTTTMGPTTGLILLNG